MNTDFSLIEMDSADSHQHSLPQSTTWLDQTSLVVVPAPMPFLLSKVLPAPCLSLFGFSILYMSHSGGSVLHV